MWCLHQVLRFNRGSHRLPFPSRSLERFFFWKVRIIIRNVPRRPQPAPFARANSCAPSCKIMLLRVRNSSFLAHMLRMAVPGPVHVTSYQSSTSLRVRMNRSRASSPYTAPGSQPSPRRTLPSSKGFKRWRGSSTSCNATCSHSKPF